MAWKKEEGDWRVMKSLLRILLSVGDRAKTCMKEMEREKEKERDILFWRAIGEARENFEGWIECDL